MRGLFILSMVLVVSNVPSGAVAQQEPGPVFEPSSPWHLDGSEERCRLARRFGEGESSLMLFMEMHEPSAYVDIMLAGPAMDKIRSRQAVSLVFGDLPPITVEKYTIGSLEGSGTALMTSGVSFEAPETEPKIESDGPWEDTLYEESGLPGAASERFVGVESLSVMQGDKFRATIRMPNFHTALEAFDICTENFVTFWGLDLEKHKTRIRGPKWKNLKPVVRRIQQRYPAAALRAGEQGIVRFRVLVDEAGRVTDCQQSDATLLDKLDSPICREMQRAQFDPALDAEGKPMRSYYASKVRYVLPR